MPSPFTTVLCSPDLVSLVGRFQDGLPEDILPFRSVLTGYSKRLKPSSLDLAAIADIDALVRPWLTRHGHTRLHHMCCSLSLRRDTLLLYAAYVGDIALMDTLLTRFPSSASEHLPLVKLAIAGGSVPTVTYLQATRGFALSPASVLKMAATFGHVSMLEAVESLLPPMAYYSPLKLAMRRDHVAVVAYLLPKCTSDLLSHAMTDAVSHAAMQCLRALPHGIAPLDVKPFYDAGKRGRVDVLSFFLDQPDDVSRPYTRADMISATLLGVLRGDHDVTLVQQVVGLTTDAILSPIHFDAAVQRLCVATMALVWANPSRWRAHSVLVWTSAYNHGLLKAVKHGSLAMVQCLVSQGGSQFSVDWSKLLVDAASVRQVAIVKWLVESKSVVPADGPTLERALMGVAKSSRSHLKAAALELLDYLASRLGPEYDWPTSFVLQTASTERYVFQFFWSRWWPIQVPDTRQSVGHACLVAAAEQGKLKSVEMLVLDFNVCVTEDVLEAAKQSHCTRLVDFLR
ncbi:Aste57867_1971 [Aphanomyces stellatus]|uniref:Aste57867_1971 protein n=1 Tax=Aphanomyces stellatus TaxID=120398 RepID=A0A485KC26_9STRA|nr:hypothetical protein As57867_001969 [Aphanomyces stellatus]VFT79176.1 Aste57867_1971 [Aphanomyces stellatus]